MSSSSSSRGSSVLLLLVLSLALTLFAIASSDCDALEITRLEFGHNIPALVRDRVQHWTAQFLHSMESTPATAQPRHGKSGAEGIRMVISLGNTAISRALIPQREVEDLLPESFILRSNYSSESKVLVIAGEGNVDKGNPVQGHMGAVYACYHMLERVLGVSFLAHPFEPQRSSPSAVLSRIEALTRPGGAINAVEQPQWPSRGIHVHTMHPLELTELLNGFGQNFSVDSWHILPEYDMMLEWLVANRQNKLEWVLLWSKSWKEYADSPLRRQRLRQLVERAHEYGLQVGIDVPIALRQQHSWALIRLGDKRDPIVQIRERLDYIAPVFDFLGTELGFSEFTHGSATDMVQFLNEISRYLDEQHGGKRVFSKVHCSQGQIVQEYNDPITGKPGCNFNFLPYHSDKLVGVFPHTVQMYSLDDPAFTYGAPNFTFMGEFMYHTSKTQQRQVIWYPETAYWIDYDINVPLMLPVYAHRRVYDFHSIVKREKRDGFKIDGTFFFSSGWEFTYWLNDVVNMRASWNPHTELSVDDAVTKLLEEVTQIFDTGEKDREVSTDIARELTTLIKEQVRLLIFGSQKNHGDVELKSGIAYLQGGDTWSEISTLVEDLTGKNIVTNPRRVSLLEVERFGQNLKGTVKYERDLQPLLKEMHEVFGACAARLAELQSRVAPETAGHFDEIVQSAQILAARASYQMYLYQFAFGKWKGESDSNLEQLRQNALDQIMTADTLMRDRLKHFRMPVDALVGWRPNPTAYQYAYLFQARTLFFWWRDYGRVVLGKTNPCYMNLISPVDIVVGEGLPKEIVEFIKLFFENFKWLKWVAECLVAPKEEPTIPPFDPGA